MDVKSLELSKHLIEEEIKHHVTQKFAPLATETSPTQERVSARMSFPKFSSVPRSRTQGPFPPSPLPEPPTLDRSRQVLREEEKEEMSLWERPRGPGKDQKDSGAVPLLPGLSAIVDGEPRRAGRREEEGERQRGRGQGKFAEEEPPLSSDRPAGTPGAILGLWEQKFSACTGAKQSGGLGAQMRPSPGVSSCSRRCHLSGKKKENKKKKRESVKKSRATHTSTSALCNGVSSPPQSRKVAQGTASLRRRRVKYPPPAITSFPSFSRIELHVRDLTNLGRKVLSCLSDQSHRPRQRQNQASWFRFLVLKKPFYNKMHL